MKGARKLSCIAFALLLLLAAGAAWAQKPVKIGVITSLTGTNAEVGQDMERGIQLAFDRIKEGYQIPMKAGKYRSIGPGLLDGTVKLIVENTESRPQSAMDATRKLVNVDHVPVVIGEFSSGITLPTGQFSNENEVIQISVGATSPKLRDIGPYFFNAIGLDDLMGNALARFALQDSGAKRFTSIVPNNPFGVGIEINTCDYIEGNYDAECVSRVRYKLKKSDYRAEIGAAFKSAPQAGFYTAYGTEARLILRQMFERGKELPQGWYAAYITMWTNEVKKMPRIAEGIKGLKVGVSSDFFEKEYAAPYKEKYGMEPTTAFGAYGYDAAMLVALAVEKAGSTDTDAIRDALFEVSKKYRGVTGSKTFDEDGMQVTENYLRKIYKNGKLHDYPMKD
jgi:branched-chain amino acid transport system substrate-binding protein